MRFNAEEQETLDKLGYFLRDWGKYLAAIVVLIIIAYVGDASWNWYQNKDTLKIAATYETFTEKFNAGDTNSVYQIADQMDKNYPSAEYTSMAAMLAAKMAKDKNNSTLAEKYLKFTIDNARDKGFVDIARLRLADIYIDEHKDSLVLPLLMAKHDKSFDALYYSKRGDLHLAKGDKNKARDSYKEALKIAGDNQSVTQVIQMRLDVLGGN
jgi:predicted negative regulator of RcsB-dependent stress response